MTFTIRGCVTTGQGQGKIFVNYDWVQNQIQAKFGFTPYPGTFNLLLDSAEKSLVEATIPPLDVTTCFSTSTSLPSAV